MTTKPRSFYQPFHCNLDESHLSPVLHSAKSDSTLPDSEKSWWDVRNTIQGEPDKFSQ